MIPELQKVRHQELPIEKDMNSLKNPFPTLFDIPPYVKFGSYFVMNWDIINGCIKKSQECADFTFTLRANNCPWHKLTFSIYNNPDLLIFDEFTSSLDLKTEEGILDNIKKYKGKKTIIIISHKLSTLKDCDKIFEVKDGEILTLKEL